MKTVTKKTTRSTTRSKVPDATTLLRADHKLISGLFAEYEKTRSTEKKKKLVSRICTELTVHARVE